MTIKKFCSVCCILIAWTVPTLCLFLAMPWVYLQSAFVAFLAHTLSFFETIVIVDDKTIVLH